MSSQWERLLLNLGEWQGSFTRFSPQGQLLNDIPTVVSLTGLNNNQTVRQIIRQENTEKILEYSSLARTVLFFENGAFSQGSIQLAPFSEFGAELGLIHENRRLRLVQLFDKNGQLDQITLIREHLAGTPAKENPPLQIDDLLGEWQGEAITIYPDWRSPDTISTNLKLQLDENGRLIQTLNFAGRTITSTARIKGSIILFDQDPEKQVQVLLLPNGASATSLLKVQVRQSFILEVGWLIQPNLRQRMVRSYSDKGEWVSLTLVTEQRVKTH
ncbi:conserved hypothetical protein [Trichormus variabilis ATCC 29413]|uniref:DUF3598 domain-containing protein n=2 Tax=Anabaena variabilis TaxID=264691 RepID=Q3MGI0_TRIV2|nr:MULTISPECIES: DUF3598 family protein [Nostocaceae]ABA19906.1 conserved hypothetical protein [Trichormus variabilis ATCC 29413]MBC1215888.1 DUF3598 family protein [Trichormus variabilis ARAD]MBC1255406.1 DUF3598 family protein [Trichormus variabilis V5]MBC1266297.1 DUF3598 family protein [Trichormus variabilis FSR]MBC1304501.1 DUF3598 family protein [Trichormus variabilis N2B]